MARKYLVIQLNPDANVGEIVESIREHTDRMAIIDRPPEERNTALDGNEGSQASCHTNTTGSDEDTSFHEGFELQKRVKKSSGKKMAVERKRKHKSPVKNDMESSRSILRKHTQSTVVCHTCNTKLIMRASYGRGRLRDHALRHLNIPVAKCGECNFQAPTKYQVRRHYASNHSRGEPNVLDVKLPDNYEDLVEAILAACFPDPKNKSDMVRNGDDIQVTISPKNDELYLSMDDEEPEALASINPEPRTEYASGEDERI